MIKSHLAYVTYKNDEWERKHKNCIVSHDRYSIPYVEEYDYEYIDSTTRIAHLKRYSRPLLEDFLKDAKEYVTFYFVSKALDDLLDNLLKRQADDLSWLKIWYSIDWEVHPTKPNEPAKRHCTLLTIAIKDWKENADKARELMPEFEFDLNALPYRRGNKYALYEWMIKI